MEHQCQGKRIPPLLGLDTTENLLVYFSVTGYLLLGISTFFIFLSAAFWGIYFARFNFPGGKLLGLIASIVGFISSVLGIISFYLDYLR